MEHRDPQQAAAEQAAAPPPGGEPEVTDGVHAAADAPPADPSGGDGPTPEGHAAAAGVAQASEPAADAPADPDYRDQYLRAMAELDNVRKRARRDVGQAEARGIAKLARELLGALARVGIEPDSPKGQPFDPHCHEAIAQTPVEGAASGTIVEVYSQ